MAWVIIQYIMSINIRHFSDVVDYVTYTKLLTQLCPASSMPTTSAVTGHRQLRLGVVGLHGVFSGGLSTNSSCRILCLPVAFFLGMPCVKTDIHNVPNGIYTSLLQSSKQCNTMQNYQIYCCIPYQI